jgi:uncharacterized cysteine cluster protein YcgN (CxxCxxCC family)
VPSAALPQLQAISATAITTGKREIDELATVCYQSLCDEQVLCGFPCLNEYTSDDVLRAVAEQLASQLFQTVTTASAGYVEFNYHFSLVRLVCSLFQNEA